MNTQDFLKAATDYVDLLKFHLETVQHERAQTSDKGIKNRRKIFELEVEKRHLIKEISTKEAAINEYKKRNNL